MKRLLGGLFVSLILFSYVKAQEGFDNEDACVPYITAFNKLKAAGFVPFIEHTENNKTKLIIYSHRLKRAIEIWYEREDKTKLPKTMCLGRVYDKFELNDEFLGSTLEWTNRKETEL